MTKSERAFWILLGAGLWNDPELAVEAGRLSDDEWSQVMRMCQNTSTMGIVSDSLMMLPLSHRPGNNISAQAVINKTQLRKTHKKHNAVICDMMHILQECGAKPVLMKGQSMALEYYSPESRACGDIDIYIGAEDMPHVLDCLSARGLIAYDDIEENPISKAFIYRDVRIELHSYAARLYRPLHNARFQMWWETELPHSQESLYVTYDGDLMRLPSNDAERVALPTPEQNTFYVFYHIYHHFMSPDVQFRQFCDLARFLYSRKGQIDTVKLGEALRDFGMMKQWQVFGCFLNFYLNMPKDSIPYYDKSCEGRCHKIAKRLSHKFLRANSCKPRRKGIKNQVLRYLRCYGDAINILPIFPRDCLAYLRYVHTPHRSSAR